MYEKTRLLDSFCYFCESLHGIMDERRKIEEPVSAEFERFNKDFEASTQRDDPVTIGYRRYTEFYREACASVIGAPYRQGLWTGYG